MRYNEQYELKDHLGNVHLVLTDRINTESQTNPEGYDNAVAAYEYSPFGMSLQTLESEAYRYGFQGQEKDDDFKGRGNSYSYSCRFHDARLGRFFTVDPLMYKYSYNSPYAFAENRVIDGIELEGAEWKPQHKWNDAIKNTGRGASLIKKLKAEGVYKDGMTYAQAFGHRVQDMTARHLSMNPHQVYQCINFVTAIMTEYAHFYKLEFNLKSYRADKAKSIAPDPSYEGKWTDFHGGAENGDGKGKWGKVSNYFGALEVYHNDKMFKDISWDDIQAGDVIGTHYGGTTYHAQIVEKVETKTWTTTETRKTGWFSSEEYEVTHTETYITITQGSMDSGTTGAEIYTKTYKLSNLKKGQFYDTAGSEESIKPRRIKYTELDKK